MLDHSTTASKTPLLVSIAADQGGYELKEYLVGKLRGAGHAVTDFGDGRPKRTMIIRILSCRWPTRLPPTRWIVARHLWQRVIE